MCGITEDMISDSITALVTKDKELAASVPPRDREVDEYELDIERQCMKILLRRQPVADDFREVSTALKLITDVERIGDQAADIAVITKHVSFREYAGKVHIKEMAKAAIGLVTDCVDSYVKLDGELAN